MRQGPVIEYRQMRYPHHASGYNEGVLPPASRTIVQAQASAAKNARRSFAVAPAVG